MTSSELRLLMERFDMSIGDVAKIFGSSPRSVGRWMSGSRDVPEGVALIFNVLPLVRGETNYKRTATSLKVLAQHFDTMASVREDHRVGS